MEFNRRDIGSKEIVIYEKKMNSKVILITGKALNVKPIIDRLSPILQRENLVRD
jgi:hypothetical protein